MRLRASHLGGFFAAILSAAGLLARGMAEVSPASARALHASWVSLPLADVAAQATRFSGMPFVVDRRVDPTTPITLDAAGETAATVAAAIAERAGADVALLASMLRIAPPGVAAACEAAERVREEERRRLPAAQRRVVDTTAAWTWAAGARPRDLVAAAGDEAGIEIQGLDAIPHDHFRAMSFPALSLADRLDMLLAHFDLRMAWSAGPAGKPRGRVVPLPAVAADSVRNRPAPPPASRRQPPVAIDAFTLRVAAPLDEVLAAVAKQLRLTVDLDETSLRGRGITPREIVRTSVADVPRDRLLDAITAPLGLAWRIEGDRLRVWAPPAQ